MEKLNNEDKMKKDFAAEKAQLIKDWQKKCEETSLAVRN